MIIDTNDSIEDIERKLLAISETRGHTPPGLIEITDVILIIREYQDKIEELLETLSDLRG